MSTTTHPQQRLYCDRDDHGTGSDVEADRHCETHHWVRLPAGMTPPAPEVDPSDPAYVDPIYTTPHRYVPTGVGRWRTCQGCGRGANAGIHRQGN